MAGDSIQVQRQTVATTTTTKRPAAAAKTTRKKVTVPVGQKKAQPKKAEQQDWGLDRVKKVYHEKGFWAAVGQYLKEAFVGPGEDASKEEKEAYAQALAINGLY